MCVCVCVCVRVGVWAWGQAGGRACVCVCACLCECVPARRILPSVYTSPSVVRSGHICVHIIMQIHLQIIM